jgi:hypothetical protein
MSVSFGKIGDDRIVECDEFEVNLSNANAVYVLRELGYETDPDYGIVGDLDPADLAARCALYTAVADDGRERVGSVFTRSGGATFYEIGQREGYLKDVAARLGALAESAIREGKQISYC